jgi:hypothetical protein
VPAQECRLIRARPGIGLGRDSSQQACQRSARGEGHPLVGGGAFRVRIPTAPQATRLLLARQPGHGAEHVDALDSEANLGKCIERRQNIGPSEGVHELLPVRRSPTIGIGVSPKEA